MSLSDGKKKMSKSSQTQFSNISIIGRTKERFVKFRPSRANSRMHQASQDGLFARLIVRIQWFPWMVHRLDKDARPEIYNLVSLMAAATNQTLEAVYEQYKVVEG